MLKKQKPAEKDRRVNEKGSIDPVGGRGRSSSPCNRQCKCCSYNQKWGHEICNNVTDIIRRALVLEIRRILSAMSATRRDTNIANSNKANRFPVRPRHVLTTWRCEELREGGWGARVCRDVLGIGRSLSCKQHQCSKMKERLDKHLLHCQAASKASTVKPHRENTINTVDRGSSTTTKASVKISTSRQNSPIKRNSEIQTPQTILSSADLNRNPKQDKQVNEIDKKQSNLKGGNKIKASVTREIFPNRNLYRERLNSEIQEFFYDIPVFPNTSEMVKQKRLYIIRNFVDNIADLFVNMNNDDYYDKVRDEIEQCLRTLPMWEPESDRDKDGFKNCLAESLLKFIKTFNEQWYSFRKESQWAGNFPNSFVSYNNHMNHTLENVITDWVQCNLKTYSKTEIVIDTLIKKIQPILETGTKHVTKAEVLKIFEDLRLPSKKALELKKFASDLTNVLSTMEGKDEFFDDCDYKKRIEFEDDEISTKILEDSNLIDDLHDETVNQITDILFGNIHLVLHENSLDVVRDVRSVLKSTGEFTDSEAANLAKTLVTNVKDCFNEEIYTKMRNPKNSKSFVILTSEKELPKNGWPFHSTPTSSARKKEIPTFQTIATMNEISVWMNEQPSDVFFVSDKATRNQLLQEIATKVQEKLVDKKSEEELTNEIAQWLDKIVKPQMKRNVDGLAESLKDKIINLSQDETPSRVYEKRMNIESSVKHIEHSYENSEADVKVYEYVENFIQRYYRIDDDIVKGVLTLILKQELLKLSPSKQEELYKQFSNDEFNADKFKMELEIVIEVYDWLKRISFYYPLLKSGTETIDFVHGLARNITDIERERVNYPNRMDYNSWLLTEIAVYLLQKEQEMNEKDLSKIDYQANELCRRIFNLRKDCSEGELNKIIAEHMKKYDSLLAKDYLKKILWHRRLGENVMKMLTENPAASRTDVEKTLAAVPVPRDESVLKFKIEIKYNITIQDWLHALPLIPPKDNEDALKRKNMIEELLQEIIKTDERKGDNPRDSQADEDLDEYIADWISRLNLDPLVHVDVRALLSQLRCGIEFIKFTEKQSLQTSNTNLEGSINRTRHSPAHDRKPKDPGEQIVEAIDSWCNNLPIEADTVEAAKAIKEQVATNMFQIVGSLNGDPRIAYDKEKFRETMANEIDAQLQNLSEHDAVTENKDILKVELLEKIIEIKDMIRDVNAGDDYVQALECTIDKSFSKPPSGSCIKTNPGYELFKKRMVMLWLLQNYDYAVNFHSLKYKKLLSDEINLMSEVAHKEGVFPADNEVMMNDLISALYKTQPPNEDAIVYEIEYIKLKCEIESWAKELPLRTTFGYKKLLERDQILTILSKILFDIERNEETNVEEKMRAEIMKWSTKLPLLPSEKENLTRYADLLVCLLKASADSRKCQRQPESNNLTVIQETLKNLKSSDELNKIRDNKSVPKMNPANTSQVAGPSAPRSCTHECGVTKEKLTYLITEAIDNWSNQLPLEFSPNEQNIAQRNKEEIKQRLMHLVSELHYRPNTLNNEGLYEHYLNNEIENILIQLAKDRLYWEAQLERNNRKYQLINALKAIRPLVQSEKEKEAYKEKLKHTISSFHESMAPYSAVQLSKDTQMAIVDDFLQYKNHKGDFESQELYKLKINETLNNELNYQEINVDPLLATNRLICEMSKVKHPIQSNATQRRYSQPNPIGTSSLPWVPAKRHSLPYTLPQEPYQRRVHQQFVMPFPEPAPQSQPYAMPITMPGPPARSFYQTSDFQQGAVPVPSPRTVSQRTNDIQTSMPFAAPCAGLRRPSEMQYFPEPRIISQNQPDLQHEPVALPGYPLAVVPQTNFEMRPFPMPPATHNSPNTNFLSQPCQGQGHAQQGFDETFYRELQEPQNDERQNMYSNVREPGVYNSPRSVVECPEEQRRTNRQGEEMCDRERRHLRRDYCETCERNRDCAYNIIPRPYQRGPYPMPADYMFYY